MKISQKNQPKKEEQMSSLWEAWWFLCIQYWDGPPFCMNAMVLCQSVGGTAWVRWKPRLRGRLSPWQVPIDSIWGRHRGVCCSVTHSNTMVIEPAFGTVVDRCQVLMKNESRRLHAPCQHREAWSALQFPRRWLNWLWTSENTVDQQQSMKWLIIDSGNYTLDFKQHG